MPVDLETLVYELDFVSIHAPLTTETRGMFGETQFQRMKPTAYVINVARGD
jgi:D-3-phosphoglycerate dehydrogenase